MARNRRLLPTNANMEIIRPNRHLLTKAVVLFTTVVIGAAWIAGCAHGAPRRSARAPYKWRPRLESCVPAPREVRARRGHWLLYFDGFAPSRRTTLRHLGISSPDKTGYRALVTVYAPGDRSYQAIERIGVAHVYFLRWPADFRGAPRVQPTGIYTVVWRVLQKHETWCAGFVVKP